MLLPSVLRMVCGSRLPMKPPGGGNETAEAVVCGSRLPIKPPGGGNELPNGSDGRRPRLSRRHFLHRRRPHRCVAAIAAAATSRDPIPTARRVPHRTSRDYRSVLLRGRRRRTLPPMSPMRCWRLPRRTRRYPLGRGSVAAKIVRVRSTHGSRLASARPQRRRCRGGDVNPAPQSAKAC